MLLVLILFHLLLSNAFVESIKCDQIVKDPSQQEITISKKAAIKFSIDDAIVGELNLEDNPNLADDETYLEIVNRLPITETKMIHHHAQILEQFSGKLVNNPLKLNIMKPFVDTFP